MTEYLSLALKQTGAYGRILAITFTNKAANEIKQRILETLQRLSLMTTSHIPEKDTGLVETLKKNTGLSEEQLFINADKVLTSILHHYSDFAISTIDAFMHRIIRSFAFDFKLSVNFEVETEPQKLLDTAVDELISKVGSNQELTDILVKYAIGKAEEEDNWDLSGDLKKKAGALLKEKMAGLMEVLKDRQLTEQDLTAVTGICQTSLSALKNEGERIIALIHKAGFEPTDLKQGMKGIAKLYVLAAAGEVCDLNTYMHAAINESDWVAKKSPLESVVSSLEAELVKSARKIIELNRELRLYSLVIKNFHTTLLIRRIHEELQTIRIQRNIIPISDFNALIHNLIRETTVPFIYERTGEKYHHYMIDEFQDTSEMQWQNLLPLFENSLASGYKNMIVGDGKQAIYRFKNGNALQFVQLPKLTGSDADVNIRLREQHLHNSYFANTLKINYRSRKEIVDFNNAFFTYAAPLFISEHQDFYLDVHQDCKEDNTGGMVTVLITERAQITANIVQTIRQATADGYAPGDIAILCRRNADAVTVAEALQKEGIGVVSSESLLLCNAREVNFLINWVGFIANQDDKIYLQAIITYLLTKYNSALSEYQILRKPDKAFLAELFDKLHVDINTAYLTQMSFYDCIELIAREFKLYDENPVYIRTLMDKILDFTRKDSSGATGFITHWEENRKKWSVSLPVQKEAVQILTVHKSKGLDFPVVIFAYPDLRSNRSDMTWSNINLRDDLTLPLIYDYSEALKDTVLESDYKIEKSLSDLDKFNLYYVALTRASERLYILVEPAKQDDKKKTIEKLDGLIDGFVASRGGTLVYGTGNKVKGKYKETISTNEPESAIDITLLQTDNWRKKLLLAGRSQADWSRLLQSVAITPSAFDNDKILHGNLVHSVLSKTNTLRDIPGAVDEALQEFNIEDLAIKEKLLQIMEVVTAMPGVDKFFGDGVIMKETEIIDQAGNIYRPDRVVLKKDVTYVIDYKTGMQSEKHINQLAAYLRLIHDMGYTNPRGYLLYIGDKPQIQQVHLTGQTALAL